MKIIGFSSYLNNAHLKDLFQCNIEAIGTKDDLLAIIKEIDAYRDEITAFYVDVCFNNSDTYSQLGTDLIKWLRIKRFQQPIVAYSVFSLECLLRRRPDNVILCSPGVRFIQIPTSEVIDIGTISGIAETTDIKAFLEPSFNITDYRHKHANWWGLKQMFDIFNISGYSLNKNVKPNIYENNERIGYPPIISKNLTDINNAIGNYLYEKDYTIYSRIIDELNQIHEMIRTNNQELEKIKGEKRKLDINSPCSIGNDEAEISKQISSLSLKIEQYEAQKNKLSETLNPLETKVFKFKKRLSACKIKNSFKILYIDDQAEEGWSDIIPRCIYVNGYDKKNFHALSGEEVAKIAEPAMNNNELPESFREPSGFDVILLDLRLTEEDEYKESIDEVSGIKVLKAIRRKCEGVPVIITTASNKAWNFETVFKHGADGYWIKEGIDNYWSENESISNYCKLAEMVNKLTGIEYQLYKEYVTKKNLLKEKKETHWWEEHTWAKNDTTTCEKKKIFDILDNVGVLFKNYLISQVMGYGAKNLDAKPFVKMMLKELCFCHEIIHSHPQTFSDTLKARKDNRLFNNLNLTRNEAVHGAKTNDFALWEKANKSVNGIASSYSRDFASFISKFFEYLNSSP